VLADSAMLKWPGLFARRYRLPRVVDGFLVPATAEPLITCTLNRLAEFQERDVGGAWVPRQVRRGDIFVTGSTTPYELRWRSPLGAEMDVIHIHLAVDQCLAAFEMVYQDKARAVEVTDFFGRDETLAHLAESISIQTLSELAELSPFHFSRVFKQTTGMTPLQFVIRERMLQAQQLIRETSRSLIEMRSKLAILVRGKCCNFAVTP
jgi:AraC-like DNA-binding protein